MKNSLTILAVGAISAVTVVAALTAPTVVHQVAVFAGGSFAILGALAVCVARNIGHEEVPQAAPVSTGYVPVPARSVSIVLNMRQNGYPDETIASALRLPLDEVRSIK